MIREDIAQLARKVYGPGHEDGVGDPITIYRYDGRYHLDMNEYRLISVSAENQERGEAAILAALEALARV